MGFMATRAMLNELLSGEVEPGGLRQHVGNDPTVPPCFDMPETAGALLPLR